MARSRPVGADLPTPGQLRELQRLSAAVGQPYRAPRTGKQARGRIQDLQIRQRSVRRAASRAGSPQTKSQNRKSPLRDNPWADLPRLLNDLSRAWYTHAKAVEQGRKAEHLQQRAHALEVSIDRLMGTPLDA